MPKLVRFRVKDGAHEHTNKVIYKANETFWSDRDEQKRFPNKFDRLDERNFKTKELRDKFLNEEQPEVERVPEKFDDSLDDEVNDEQLTLSKKTGGGNASTRSSHSNSSPNDTSELDDDEEEHEEEQDHEEEEQRNRRKENRQKESQTQAEKSQVNIDRLIS